MHTYTHGLDHRYATYKHNDFHQQWEQFRQTKGTSCFSTFLAKYHAYSAMRQRGEWEENDDQRVAAKTQRLSAAFDQYRLPNGGVVGISHKSYLDRCAHAFYVCVCTSCPWLCWILCCMRMSHSYRFAPVSTYVHTCTYIHTHANGGQVRSSFRHSPQQDLVVWHLHHVEAADSRHHLGNSPEPDQQRIGYPGHAGLRSPCRAVFAAVQ